MFLLDTNVVSELRKAPSGKADERVVEWAAAQTPERLFICSTVILETELGALRIIRRDPRQGMVLRNWIDRTLIPEFADRTLAMDIDVALQAAALHVPDPKPERDAIIAATALVHDMTLVTRNTVDFVATGVRLFNPWGEAGP